MLRALSAAVSEQDASATGGAASCGATMLAAPESRPRAVGRNSSGQPWRWTGQHRGIAAPPLGGGMVRCRNRVCTLRCLCTDRCCFASACAQGEIVDLYIPRKWCVDSRAAAGRFGSAACTRTRSERSQPAASQAARQPALLSAVVQRCRAPACPGYGGARQQPTRTSQRAVAPRLMACGPLHASELPLPCRARPPPPPLLSAALGPTS